MSAKLYTPFTAGAITASNRMVVAPMTRARAQLPGRTATDLMAEYYGQRATAGLVITECVMVSANTSGFFAEPGLYEDAQIAGWQKVTNAIHSKGAKAILQIWHGGRVCPAGYNGGVEPVAPSAVACGFPYYNVLDNLAVTQHAVPRALTDDEAKRIIDDFGASAKRAIAAGFDGVEIHGANGYLINQFLVSSANKRTADTSVYSGETIETRARYLLDVVDACSGQIGASRVGVRLSPHVSYNQAVWDAPETDIPFVASALQKKDVAFIHVMRRDMMNPAADKTLDCTPLFRKHFSGTIISNIEFERAEAEQYVEDGKADAIAIGTPFLTNPDLVRRFVEKNDARNTLDPTKLYGGGAEGYTDYPYLPQ